MELNDIKKDLYKSKTMANEKVVGSNPSGTTIKERDL